MLNEEVLWENTNAHSNERTKKREKCTTTKKSECLCYIYADVVATFVLSGTKYNK